MKNKWMLDRYELLKAFKKVNGSKEGLVDEKELLYVLAKFEVYVTPPVLFVLGCPFLLSMGRAPIDKPSQQNAWHTT